MIAVMSRIRVCQGDSEALADQYRQRSRLVEQQPGCLGVEILRNRNDPDEFVVYTRWHTEADYQNYRRSSAYRHAHQRISDIPGGLRIDSETRTVESYEVLS